MRLFIGPWTEFNLLGKCRPHKKFKNSLNLTKRYKIHFTSTKMPIAIATEL